MHRPNLCVPYLCAHFKQQLPNDLVFAQNPYHDSTACWQFQEPRLITKAQRRAALLRQITRLDTQLHDLHQRSDRYVNIRLLVVVIGVPVVSVLFFVPSLRLAFWVAAVLFVVAFVGAVVIHRRIRRSIRELDGWRTIKQTHIARMELNWKHIPKPPHRTTTAHPLAVDLDLYQLHRLVNTAVSVSGSKRLQTWLIADQPDISISQQRQALVRELVNQPRYRDKLTLRAMIATDEIHSSNEGQTLVDWLQTPTQAVRGTLLLLTALSAVNIALFLGVAFFALTDTLLFFTLTAYALLFVSQFRKIQNIFEESLTLEGALRRIDAVMRFMEQDRYSTMPQLRRLVAPIVEDKPSRALRRATGVISGASLRANPIFWLLVNAVVPWDYFFALRLENLKDELRDHLPRWLDVWHEVEALGSLATHAYLNPANTFPQVEPTTDPVFRVEQLGHPLIKDEERVSNSFTLSDVGDMVVITGSNMAGKSSFLRALGVNLCLAYAGGAACAPVFHTSAFRLYTSIRVTDSLDDGISYFYAEVRRLKGLLEAIEQPNQPPVFFLIDEIFRGTNNRERLIGSRSFIRALVGHNGVGLIATHDLELVALADESDHIRNFHFREDVQDGRMVFDYILREGPSPTTNALRIMKMEGLPVEIEV